MSYTNMPKGTRVYYTGDMANIEAEGTICRVNPAGTWGMSYDIVFDDGRLFRGVNPLSFEAGPGRRFWPLDEWMEHRQQRIEAMQQRYKELGLL